MFVCDLYCLSLFIPLLCDLLVLVTTGCMAAMGTLVTFLLYSAVVFHYSEKKVLKEWVLCTGVKTANSGKINNTYGSRSQLAARSKA